MLQDHEIPAFGSIPASVARPDSRWQRLLRHRVWSRLPAPLLLVLGVAAGTTATILGLLGPDAFFFVTGLVALALLLAAVVITTFGVRRWFFRSATGVLCLAIIVGVGVTVPKMQLADEFDGTGVQWTVSDRSMSGTAQVMFKVDNTVVIKISEDQYQVVSLSDGHQFDLDVANKNQTVRLAGHRILAGPQANYPGNFVLYDLTGARLWTKVATTALAYSGPVTVLENCVVGRDCVETGYADDGHQVWQASSGGWQPRGRRFASAQTLPMGSSGEVLPSIALWATKWQPPATPYHWQFTDPATGKVQYTATSREAGVAGDTMVTIGDGPIGSRFALAWVGATATPVQVEVPTETAFPVAVGGFLFNANTVNNPMIDIARVVKTPPDAGRIQYLGPANVDGADLLVVPTPINDIAGYDDPLLQVDESGCAWADGRTVTGRGWSGSLNRIRWGGKAWVFVAESDRTAVSVERGTALVASDIPRSNPFDHTPGYEPRNVYSQADTRLTMLELASGVVTGSLRIHGGYRVAGVGDGSALVFIPHKIMLLGSPAGG